MVFTERGGKFVLGGKFARNRGFELKIFVSSFVSFVSFAVDSVFVSLFSRKVLFRITLSSTESSSSRSHTNDSVSATDAIEVFK